MDFIKGLDYKLGSTCDYRLEEAYGQILLGRYLKAAEQLKEYLRIYNTNSLAWYLMSLCQNNIGDTIFCLSKALANSYGDWDQFLDKFLRWHKREEKYEYKEIILKIRPQRKVKLEDTDPRSSYREIRNVIANWWEQDETQIITRIDSFRESGWEILSEVSKVSYEIEIEEVNTVIDYFRKRNAPKEQSYEERILDKNSKGKEIKEILEVLAAITFVLIFATGGMGVVIIPIIILGIVIAYIFSKNTYIIPASYRIKLRRERETSIL